MTYQQHRWGGVAFALLAMKLIPGHGLMVVPAFFVALAASLLPDFDHKGSFVSRRIPFVYYLYKWGLSNWITWWLFGKERMRGLVKHRYGTHTLVVWLLLTLLWGGFVHALLGGLLQATDLTLAMIAPEGVWFPLGQWLGARGQVAAYYASIFAAGYASHIVLDMATKEGVPLLYPWTKRRFYILPRQLRLKSS